MKKAVIGCEASGFSIVMVAAILVSSCGGSGGDLFVQKESNGDLIQCVTKIFDGTTGDCLTTDEWIPKAMDTCTAEERIPEGDPVFTGECGQDQFGGDKKYSGMIFQCCLPPSPTGCTAEYQGNAQTCNGEQRWRDLAMTACEAKGKELGAIEFIQSCMKSPGAGGPPPERSYRLIKYDCCTATGN